MNNFKIDYQNNNLYDSLYRIVNFTYFPQSLCLALFGQIKHIY